MASSSDQRRQEANYALVYRGAPGGGVVERQAVALQLAQELELPLHKASELDLWVGSPLCTMLTRDEAEWLAAQFDRMGVRVEVREPAVA